MLKKQPTGAFQKFNLRWNLQLPLPLLIEALTHPSYKSVDPSISDNQRLETLGDSVIDLLVLEWLYNKNIMTEGDMTKKRAEIVQNTTLAKLGEKLQIDPVLRCAPAYTIQEKDLADAVEAIFGALYVANGLAPCQAFLLQLFENFMDNILLNDEIGNIIQGKNEYNPKNRLQEFFQQRQIPEATYQLLKREGPDHDPEYWYLCQGTYQNKGLTGKGQGKNKKEAQMKAAQDLYNKLLQLENRMK
ncbi:MAG: hypothetical protein JSW11_10525 [Candidatus Heimdallarchaeota archaeon]|nr:MAG: hypothetical protein JSW11_10525 [Candidatus Heimdallarchaeota archaeon]